MLVAYVSGHGFGHATRTAEVLRALCEREPEVGLTVVTSAPEWLFREALRGPFTYRSLECDVGLVQRDALVIDEPETARRCAEFATGWKDRVAAEATFLRQAGARVVLGDIPPLAFAAAHAAGVPAVALANFSWDWIYRHAARYAPELHQAADHCAAAYAHATLLLRLPFAGDLAAFPHVEDIALVARRPRVEKAEARQRLNLDGRPAVLFSFGGIGLPGFRAATVAPLQEFQFLLPQPDGLPTNAVSVHGEKLHGLGLAYEDVVGAADAIVTKPGYGIVTDAIGARTRLVYTERGDFPEYEILVAGMPAFLPCAYVSNEEVRGGRVAAALERVFEMPFPPEPDLTGAEQAAHRLAQLLEGPHAGAVKPVR